MYHYSCASDRAELTSDDGQLGVDCNFALLVLGDAFVDVLVARRSEGLDSEYGAGPLVKLDGLQGEDTHTEGI